MFRPIPRTAAEHDGLITRRVEDDPALVVVDGNPRLRHDPDRPGLGSFTLTKSSGHRGLALLAPVRFRTHAGIVGGQDGLGPVGDPQLD